MTINLLNLLSEFRVVTDHESQTAFFRTHVPWVAPEAYLHMIFKPAARDVLADAAQRQRIPPVFQEFLAIQNGAILFSGALSIYGVVHPGQPLERSATFSRLPFSIESENSDWRPYDPDRFLAIGGYGFDGSRACIDRRSLQIALFQRGEAGLLSTPLLSWKSLEQWVREEISRLSALFDANGKRLVNESQTLPHSGMWKHN